MPAQVRVRDEKGRFTKLAQKWIEVNYPEHLQVPGAPIVTERTPLGTRHVPGGSPWGGYDLSATALHEPEEESAAVLRREAIEVDHEITSTTPRPGHSIGD